MSFWKYCNLVIYLLFNNKYTQSMHRCTHIMCTGKWVLDNKLVVVAFHFQVYGNLNWINICHSYLICHVRFINRIHIYLTTVLQSGTWYFPYIHAPEVIKPNFSCYRSRCSTNKYWHECCFIRRIKPFIMMQKSEYLIQTNIFLLSTLLFFHWRLLHT